MNKQDKNRALLPSGFADLLPPEAGQEADAIAALLTSFQKFGYNRVKPPLVEFEDGLLAPGPGSALSAQTFRLMDPLSHRMMGVRADITAQIARIVSSRLSAEQRPLRLTYANDVLRTKGSQQRTARQFCQVGCEIIGPEDDQADIEICVVALSALAALDLGPVTLDLNLPRLSDLIFTEYDVVDHDRATIMQAVLDRDLDALSARSDDASSVFAALLQASGSAQGALGALVAGEYSEAVKAQIEKLCNVHDGIASAIGDLGLSDVSLTIDVLESKGLEYHCGIAFGFYCDKARGPLGRGGRYDVVFDNDKQTESATGFTLYMDTVRSAMPVSAAKDIVFVPMTESWGVIQSLQEEGWIVTRGTGHNKKPATCTHEYIDGQVKPLK